MEVLNLDLDPEYRWIFIINKRATEISKIVDEICETPLNKDELCILRVLYKTIISDSLRQELKSIGKLLQKSYFKMLKFNLIIYYFLLQSNNFVYKSNRNTFVHIMSVMNKWSNSKVNNLFIKLRVHKGGKIIYTTLSILGCVGLFNAVNEDFTLNLNTSYSQEIVDKPGNMPPFIFRGLLDEYCDYDFMTTNLRNIDFNNSNYTAMISYKNVMTKISRSKILYIGKMYYSDTLTERSFVDLSVLLCEQTQLLKINKIIEESLIKKDEIMMYSILICKGSIVHYVKVD